MIRAFTRKSSCEMVQEVQNRIKYFTLLDVMMDIVECQREPNFQRSSARCSPNICTAVPRRLQPGIASPGVHQERQPLFLLGSNKYGCFPSCSPIFLCIMSVSPFACPDHWMSMRLQGA